MKIKFYESNSGKKPALKFLKSLQTKDKAKILACLESIEELGLKTPRVTFRQIRGQLWEIKISSQSGGFRIFYITISSDNLVLLHAYKKQSQKAPKKEIETAEKRMKEVLKNESYYT